MDTKFIELWRECPATAVIVENKDISKLKAKVLLQADCSDEYLFDDAKEIIGQANKLAGTNDIVYFVIKDFDSASVEQQLRFVGLIKDRELSGNKIADNVIIILNILNKRDLEGIASVIYHFCVLA